MEVIEEVAGMRAFSDRDTDRKHKLIRGFLRKIPAPLSLPEWVTVAEECLCFLCKHLGSGILVSLPKRFTVTGEIHGGNRRPRREGFAGETASRRGRVCETPADPRKWPHKVHTKWPILLLNHGVAHAGTLHGEGSEVGFFLWLLGVFFK